MARHAMKPSAFSTKTMPMMAGQVTKRRKATPRRGPIMSQMKPVTARITMFVETAAMFAEPIWLLVRSSAVGLRMYEMRGAAANIEKKEEKKANHETWKARWCGREQLVMISFVALCSWSTGTWN